MNFYFRSLDNLLELHEEMSWSWCGLLRGMHINEALRLNNDKMINQAMHNAQGVKYF